MGLAEMEFRNGLKKVGIAGNHLGLEFVSVVHLPGKPALSRQAGLQYVGGGVGVEGLLKAFVIPEGQGCIDAVFLWSGPPRFGFAGPRGGGQEEGGGGGDGEMATFHKF